MVYEVMVTIVDSPTKIIGWGYLIKAENEINAKIEALNMAKIKASKPRSRYKKCTFIVKEGNCIAKPNW